MQIQNMILELYRELCKYKIKKTSENFLRFHNFQFDVDAPITSYLFFNGVMCHVSRIFAVTKINKKNNFANIKIVRERREKVWEQLNVS